MSSRRPALWRKVVAFVPLLVVAASVPGHVLLRCRMDGGLRAACCCPSEKTDGSEPSGPAVSDRGCCDRLLTSGSEPPLASAPLATPVVEAAVAVALPSYCASIQPQPRYLPRGLQRDGPAREGPALLILKQTFLI
jgi:hypothetical protein